MQLTLKAPPPFPTNAGASTAAILMSTLTGYLGKVGWKGAKVPRRTWLFIWLLGFEELPLWQKDGRVRWTAPLQARLQGIFSCLPVLNVGRGTVRTPTSYIALCSLDPVSLKRTVYLTTTGVWFRGGGGSSIAFRSSSRQLLITIPSSRRLLRLLPLLARPA